MTGQIPEWRDHVGAGWHPILDDLHSELLEISPDYQVAQLTEKFAGLRVYLERYDPVTGALIKVAEDASFKVCEVCGKPGRRGFASGSTRWVKTLCDEHRVGGNFEPYGDDE